MIRSDILREIAPLIRDHLVICNIGIPSQELHAIDDQPGNFYMLGTMGPASSIGLGLALAQPKKVIAIDGDGSVLTNLGTLPTIGNNPGVSTVASTPMETMIDGAEGHAGLHSLWSALAEEASLTLAPLGNARLQCLDGVLLLRGPRRV